METINKYSRKHVFDAEGDLLPVEQRTYKTLDRLGAYEVVLIDGASKANHVTCKLGEHIFVSSLQKVKQGKIKNPYHPNIHGTGFVGSGKYLVAVNRVAVKAYTVWHSMLTRCYDPKSLIKTPTYKDVTVHTDWHNYQNFAEWFEQSNYQEGWDLDKDILSSTGNKVYSEKTCLFVPHAMNSFITCRQSNNTSGFAGVHFAKHTSKYEAYISIGSPSKRKHLGVFPNLKEASEAYRVARAVEAQAWKDRMIGILPKQAIDNIK